jgi:hypothetical protein
MSELGVAEGIQAVVRDITDHFLAESVVINDWSVSDREVGQGPFLNIMTANDFRNRQDTVSEQAFWTIPAALVVPFVDWNTTMSDFRTYRQAILDKFNEVGTARSADGLTATTIDEIRSGGPIEAIFANYNDPANRADETPQSLAQFILFSCEEF